MSTVDELRAAVQDDVDDILSRARDYDAATRLRMLRSVAEHYADLKEPIERVKAASFVQSMLGTMQGNHVPLAISADLAERLAAIVESEQEPQEARRCALNSLALLFLRAAQLTDSLDATIRAAFVAARKVRDVEMSELASEVLSSRGVLSRRASERLNTVLTVD